MGRAQRAASIVGGLAVILLLGVACDSTPLPEAVLEGAWKVVKDSEADGDNYSLVNFDERGVVTRVTDVTGSIEVENNNASGQGSIDGFHVEVLTSTNLLFIGEFNEGFTEATGELFTRIDFFGVVTRISQGDATMRRN